MSSQDSHVSRSSHHSSSSGRSRHGDAESSVPSSRHSAAGGGGRLYDAEGSVVGSEFSRASRRSGTSSHSRADDRDSHVSSSRHSSSGRSRHSDGDSHVSSYRHSSVSGSSRHSRSGDSTVSSSRHSGSGGSTVSRSSRHSGSGGSTVSSSSRHSGSGSTASSYRHSAGPGDGGRLYDSEGSDVGSDVSRSSCRSSSSRHSKHGRSGAQDDGGLATRLRGMTINEEEDDEEDHGDKDYVFLIGRKPYHRKECPDDYFVILHEPTSRSCEVWEIDRDRPTGEELTECGHKVPAHHHVKYKKHAKCRERCQELDITKLGVILAKDRLRWDRMWQLYDPKKFKGDLLAPYAWTTMMCAGIADKEEVYRGVAYLGGDYLDEKSGLCHVEHVPVV
ncbi:hypothetical protein BDW74DRAFT_181180 [Aspergillus multicolor]|uniref:uncharacterized protein n=1 Tax=Aspergillus multicolor TaxID=41759 RepID=UPI003CCD1290